MIADGGRVMQTSSVIVTCAVGAMLAAACGGTNAPPASESAGQAKAKPAGQAAQKQAVQEVKACSLLKKNEVESSVGRALLEPIEEHTSQLSVCDYGDRAGPIVGGRSLEKVAAVSVFTGGNTYYAGPVAQVAGIYDLTLKNASDPQPVSGFGDRAFWASHSLHVLRGPYYVEVEVRVGSRDREISEQLMKTVLQRLPSGS
jgi:hypothetical protein